MVTSIKKSKQGEILEKEIVKKEDVKELMVHQKHVVDFITDPKNDSIAIFHGTGCGKTLTAVKACIELLKLYPKKQVVIISSPSIHSRFISEIENQKHSLDSFIFVTYHFFLKSNRSDIVKDRILVIDEVHNIRSTNSKIMLYIFKASLLAFKVIVMSATPIVNSVRDLLPIFSIIYGRNLFNPSVISKADARVIDNDPKLVLHHPLMQYIRNVSYFKKPIHCENPDFPDYSIHTVYVVMTNEEQRNYELFEQNLKKEIPEELRTLVGGGLGGNFLTVVNAMRRVGDSGLALSAPKIRYVINYILNNPKDRILVFSSWLKSGINVLEAKMKQKKIPFSKLTGELSKKKRDSMVKKFNDGVARVLLFTKAGGEGLDLKGVDKVFIAEPGWNSSIEQQAIDRAIRYKSHTHLPKEKRFVSVEKLLIGFRDPRRHTIDELLTKTYIKRKEKLVKVFNKIFEKISI